MKLELAIQNHNVDIVQILDESDPFYNDNFTVYYEVVRNILRGNDGLDAYQVWVAQGNIGTYDDYVKSIQLLKISSVAPTIEDVSYALGTMWIDNSLETPKIYILVKFVDAYAFWLDISYSSGGGVDEESDPIFTSWAFKSVVEGNVSYWNQAYTHTSDTTKHLTSNERINWNNAYSHISDNIKHLTATERTNWDAAFSHISGTNNPHSVTKTQIGLSNVLNVASYSKTETDNTFLGKTAKAADSYKLDGNDSSYFATAAQINVANLTPGYLPYWSGSSLQNSILHQNSSNIGIGYTNRSEKFAVSGSGYFNGSLQSTSVKIGTSWEATPNGNDLELKYEGEIKAKLTSSGDILAVGGIVAFAI